MLMAMGMEQGLTQAVGKIDAFAAKLREVLAAD
jgi:hypothetical protein